MKMETYIVIGVLGLKGLSEPRIRNNYPLVLNDHPSLSAHKLIAKSIIQFLDKKDILFRKDYI